LSRIARSAEYGVNVKLDSVCVVPLVVVRVPSRTRFSPARSRAETMIDTTADPDRFSNDPVEDCTSVRDRVVPDEVYVPVPTSQAVPSVIR